MVRAPEPPAPTAPHRSGVPLCSGGGGRAPRAVWVVPAPPVRQPRRGPVRSEGPTAWQEVPARCEPSSGRQTGLPRAAYAAFLLPGCPARGRAPLGSPWLGRPSRVGMRRGRWRVRSGGLPRPEPCYLLAGRRCSGVGRVAPVTAFAWPGRAGVEQQTRHGGQLGVGLGSCFAEQMPEGHGIREPG